MNSDLNLMLQEALNDFQKGTLTRAELILKRYVQINQNHFDAVHLLAIVCASQHNHREAIEWYEKALKLSPNEASALSNFGSSLNAIGKHHDALAVLKKALEIDPYCSEYWYNYGNVLCFVGGLEEALVHYDQAIKLNPNYYQAHNNYGKALLELNRHTESLVFFEKALAINESFLECLINKGECLFKLRQHQKALDCYKKVLTLKPDYAEAYSNMGNIFHELKCFDEAISCYDRAINLKPNYAEAWSNKGISLNELQYYDEAISHYDRALTLEPSIDWVPGYLLHAKMKICNWTNLLNNKKAVKDGVFEKVKVTNPFPLLALTDDIKSHKLSSEIYIQSKHPFNPILGATLKCNPNQKIRLGYFSADFHDHATGYLMAELFELHDKGQFELFGFSFGPVENDHMRQRLKTAFDQFIEVGNRSDMEIAQLSRNLNIDIAIDLKGFTKDARTGIFSYRAAPIQVNYLGYPGTMGADYIDYIIADKTLIPFESQAFYREKIVYLPESYQVNDRKRLISDKRFTRRELGLPDVGFVFCCFNNNYKILPEIFEGWMRILKALEGSVLWLFQDNPLAVENLKREAQKHGVDSQRLVFADRMALPEHLARHRQADLFLDTFPYNAHTTASDALWAGLPVLTLSGQSFASRVAASLLNAIDLPELITTTQENYELKAIELARNPEKLILIKRALIQGRLKSSLFDTPRFAKKLEASYKEMHKKHLANLEPANIFID